MSINEFNSQFSNVRFRTLIPKKEQEDNTPIEKNTSNINNGKPLVNQNERMVVQYDMDGITPSNGAPSNAKPVQRWNRDENYSTPRNTYLTKDEIQGRFSQEEIEKYFDYNYVTKSRDDGRQDLFLAYILKKDIEINGVKITTIDQLLEAIKNNYEENSSEVKDTKPLQRRYFDPEFSTPTDTYMKKSEIEEKFTQEEIERYFDYKYVYKSKKDDLGVRQDMFLAFVIKSGLEINGIRITTIDQLLQALGKNKD